MTKGILVALLASFALTGCNTVEGVGKDIKSAGHGLERTAKEDKTY